LIPEWRRLTWIQVYEAAERPDLVRRVERIQKIGLGLGVGGGLTAFAGLVVISVGAATTFRLCIFEPCGPPPPEPTAYYAVGGVLMGLGVASIVASIPLRYNGGLTNDEVRAIIDKHNAELLRRLQRPDLSLIVGPGTAYAIVKGRF
jgi:hypothetical protein